MRLFLHATGLSFSIPVGVLRLQTAWKFGDSASPSHDYWALFKLTVDLFVENRQERSLLSFIVRSFPDFEDLCAF
jgi:hypothetical protein